MTAQSMSDLESRAAEAERRLDVLEARVAQAGAGTSTQGASEKFREQLTALRALLVEAKVEQEKTEAERDAAQKKVAKLEYQCLHLKQAVKELDAKVAGGS